MKLLWCTCALLSLIVAAWSRWGEAREGGEEGRTFFPRCESRFNFRCESHKLCRFCCGIIISGTEPGITEVSVKLSLSSHSDTPLTPLYSLRMNSTHILFLLKMFCVSVFAQPAAAFESLPAPVKTLSVFAPQILGCIIPTCWARVQNAAEQNLERDHSCMYDRYLQCWMSVAGWQGGRVLLVPRN